MIEQDAIEALEAADPSVVRYMAPAMNGHHKAVVGFRVGHFVVRRRGSDETVLTKQGPVVGGWTIEYLEPGREAADSRSLNIHGDCAQQRAWWSADELSRHVVVDERGWVPCALAVPGLMEHLTEQDHRIARGEQPIPWHHTEEYARLRSAEAERAA